MSAADWIILACTLGGIIIYGVYKSKTSRNLEGYFLSNRSMPWYLVLLSIMGTQASAITFLSAPGQAYTDGMRFVQYYFGLPIAMVVISIFLVPLYRRLQVYTAYEFLEKRFDLKTRTFTAFLFLLSRGLSTGISIYAPSIILSSLMGWNIYLTNFVMGGLLIIYTLAGGARAVAYTQQLQLLIILSGMFIAGYCVVKLLPEGMGFSDALKVAGSRGRMNVISSGFQSGSFDWKDKYNILSGIVGGFFLALSYFGTDQSQVGRYLTAKDERESRIGLLMNGLVKVPMQFMILLVGVLVFVFHQYDKPPIFFDETKVAAASKTSFAGTLADIQLKYDAAFEMHDPGKTAALREQYKTVLKQALPGEDTNDTNYIFLRFVVDHLPHGIVGLLIAVIFLAAWGSIAAALNSLASSSVVDFHKVFICKDGGEKYDYRISRWYTLGWGIFCVAVAMFAKDIGNSLIEAVNILGSLFYGVILGIFIVAFLLRKIGGSAVFYAGIIAELGVISVYRLDSISFLWLNVLGVVFVVFLSIILHSLFNRLNIH